MRWSLSRRSNRMAERDIGDWLYARFLLPAVASQQVFDAEIMDVMRSGLKVRHWKMVPCASFEAA